MKKTTPKERMMGSYDLGRVVANAIFIAAGSIRLAGAKALGRALQTMNDQSHSGPLEAAIPDDADDETFSAAYEKVKEESICRTGNCSSKLYLDTLTYEELRDADWAAASLENDLDMLRSNIRINAANRFPERFAEDSGVIQGSDLPPELLGLIVEAQQHGRHIIVARNDSTGEARVINSDPNLPVS